MEHTIAEINEKMSSAESSERVAIKRKLRKNNIQFDKFECTPHLKEMLEYPQVIK